jgi:hypothetical protein
LNIYKKFKDREDNILLWGDEVNFLHSWSFPKWKRVHNLKQINPLPLI